MKQFIHRILCAPLLAALLLTPALAAEPAETPATPTMNTTSPNGQVYAWQPGGFYFMENASTVFVDNCRWDLLYPIKTVNGISFLSIQDLNVLYSPSFTYGYENGAFSVKHAGVEARFQVGSPTITYYGGTYTMAAAPFMDGEALYLPIFDFMCVAFGKVQSQNGAYYALGNSADFTITSAVVYNLKMFYRGKNVGKSYWAYWNNETRHLEPVVVYIPSTYSPDSPNKAIVQLHGVGGNAFRIPDGDYGQSMMEQAEEYGYVVIWPNSYVRLGNFGNWVPPAGQKTITSETDPANPGAYTEGVLADIRLSGNNVIHALNFAKTKWNIDSKNVFCMGISMGGCGTWYQAAFNDLYFSAFSPSGAFVEPEFFPWEKITKPVLYVGGTEDRNGFDLMLNAYDIALSKGCNIEQFLVVGGAGHGEEWPKRLQETYEFFESHLTPIKTDNNN